MDSAEQKNSTQRKEIKKKHAAEGTRKKAIVVARGKGGGEYGCAKRIKTVLRRFWASGEGYAVVGDLHTTHGTKRRRPKQAGRDFRREYQRQTQPARRDKAWSIHAHPHNEHKQNVPDETPSPRPSLETA